MKVGGTVYYDAFDEQNQNKANHLLIIAGGLGINPLYSMFLNIHEASKTHGNTPKTSLLYSAMSKDELIFKVCSEACLCDFASKASAVRRTLLSCFLPLVIETQDSPSKI